jgi:hypothetical protein
MIFVIYLMTLILYTNKKIRVNRLTRFRNIIEMTIITSSQVYCILFILIVFIPVDKIFEKVYYPNLKANYLFSALLTAILPLLALIITGIYFILINKSKNKNLNNQN